MSCFMVLALFTLVFPFASSSSRDAPKLGNFVPNYSQKIETKFKTLCSLQQGSSPIKFEWFKNGHPLIGSDARINIETDEDESRLSIRTLKLADSGNYSCAVRNDHGADTKWTVLVVTGWLLI